MDLCELYSSTKQLETEEVLKNDYQMILGAIMDFLRRASLHNGKVLFLEDSYVSDLTISKSVIGEYIILCLSHIQNRPVYEIYTGLRSKNPAFDVCHENLRMMSEW